MHLYVIGFVHVPWDQSSISGQHLAHLLSSLPESLEDLQGKTCSHRKILRETTGKGKDTAIPILASDRGEHSPFGAPRFPPPWEVRVPDAGAIQLRRSSACYSALHSGRGPDSEPPRLQQVGSAPSGLFFESLINFQETSPDNCYEAAPAKQTQTELSSTRLVT